MDGAVAPPPSRQPFYDPHPVPLARPSLGQREIEAALAVLRSGMLCQGDVVAEFEARFARLCGQPHAVAVSSGSTALLVALQALGVGPGDEVIVPDMTFISTATAALYLGARPVLADITLRGYGIDPARVEALVTPRTRVIVPVHYAGHTAEMAPLRALAQSRGIAILEDAAEAHLSRYQGGAAAGALGDAAIFSFTPTKPMTTGEGGMIVTGDDDLARRCRLIRNFGDEGKFAWHSLGFNFRLNEVAAAVGICQVERLPGFVDRRRALGHRYDRAFSGHPLVITPWLRTPTDGNFQLYTLRLRVDGLRITRDGVIAELARRGISSRVYYPALHRMGVMAGVGPWDDRSFPSSLEFDASALSLPLFNDMSDEQQDQVAAALLDVLETHRR